MKENKYIKHSRISEKKFRELLFAFSIDLTATQISFFTKINRNTINRILQKNKNWSGGSLRGGDAFPWGS